MWVKVTYLAQKGTCFGKLTNAAFAYLLSPTILQHFKQILKQVCIILAHFGPKLPIFFKERYIVGKLTICVPIVFYVTTNLQEQIIKQGCIILTQIGLDPVHQKVILGKSWLTLHWFFISHYAT